MLVLKTGTHGSTIKETAFNDYHWGNVTHDYAKSAKNLAKESFQEICDLGKWVTKPTQKGR